MRIYTIKHLEQMQEGITQLLQFLLMLISLHCIYFVEHSGRPDHHLGPNEKRISRMIFYQEIRISLANNHLYFSCLPHGLSYHDYPVENFKRILLDLLAKVSSYKYRTLQLLDRWLTLPCKIGNGSYVFYQGYYQTYQISICTVNRIFHALHLASPTILTVPPSFSMMRASQLFYAKLSLTKASTLQNFFMVSLALSQYKGTFMQKSLWIYKRKKKRKR